MAEETPKNVDQYKYYLLPDENIRKVYDIGILGLNLYKILLTSSRIILIKRFPKNVIELSYKNIELAEYYTNVEWMKLIFGIGFTILLGIFIVSSDFILERFIEFLPPLEQIINAGPFLGMKVGAIIVALALLVGTGYYIGFFINSLFGRLRIIIYEQAPVDIISPFDRRVADIIRTIESNSTAERKR